MHYKKPCSVPAEQGEVRQGVAVVSHTGPFKRRRKVRVGLSLHVKRDVLEQFIPQYHEASSAQKRMVLRRWGGPARLFAFLYVLYTECEH